MVSVTGNNSMIMVLPRKPVPRHFLHPHRAVDGAVRGFRDGAGAQTRQQFAIDRVRFPAMGTKRSDQAAGPECP